MIIGFDVDDTLLNLDEAIEKVFEKYNEKRVAPVDWSFSNYPEQIKKEIFELFSDSNRMCNLNPYPKAIETINELKKFDNKVIAITARDLLIAEDTINYINKIFGIKCFVVEPNKSKLDILLDEKVELWVDDAPQYLLEYKKHNIDVIMISNENTLYNYYLRDKVNWIENVEKLWTML